MAGVAGPLSDANMANAASFYARQMIRPDAVIDEKVASAGKRILLSGTGKVTACAMCHGSTGAMRMMEMIGQGMMNRGMTGMMHGMMAGEAEPRWSARSLSLLGQLDRFASGKRRAAMMGMMMTPIAAALSQTDKRAVATYLSGVP